MEMHTATPAGHAGWDAARSAPVAGSTGGGGLWGAVRFEWTKLWTVRSTWWCLAGGLVLMALWAGISGFDYAYEDTAHPAPDEPFPVGDLALAGAQLAQFAVMTLAMLVIAAEYASGSIRSTLQCVPARGRMLMSKVIVVAAVTFAAGLVLAGAGALAGGVMLRHLAEVDPAVLAQQIPTIARYLALVGLFTVGVGFAIRSAVGTLGVSVLLLVVMPLVLRDIGVDVIENIADGMPGSAGIYLLEGGSDPYGRGPASLILAGWALLSAVIGYLALRTRDASSPYSP